MGGLAIRCAASTKCGGDDAVSKLIAAVVTFDTPNLGTYLKGYGASDYEHVLADNISAACHTSDPYTAIPVLKKFCGFIRAVGTSAAGAAFTPGSAQLKALPGLPASVPVLAVAGSIKVGTSFWGRKAKVLGDAGDGIVNENSAFAAAHKIGSLGGKIIRDCGVFDVTVTVFSQPELKCTHVSETNNPDWTIVVTGVIRTLDKAMASECTAADVARDLNVPAGDVSGLTCHGEWGVGDICHAECSDAGVLVHRISSHWKSAGAVLQNCSEDLVKQGVPQSVAAQFYMACFTSKPAFIGRCYYPGDVKHARPSAFIFGCDGTGAVSKASWSMWNDSRGEGQGLIDIAECTPDCANGPRHKFSGRFVVEDPEPLSCGRFFAKLTIFIPPAADVPRSGSVLVHGQPAFVYDDLPGVDC